MKKVKLQIEIQKIELFVAKLQLLFIDLLFQTRKIILHLFFYMLREKINYLNCNLLFVMKIIPVTIDFYNSTK